MSCFLVITKDDSTITETNHSGSTVIRMTDIQNYSPELVLFILRLMMIMRRSSIRQTTTNSTDILCDLTSTVETAWQTNTGLLRLVWSEIKWEKNVSLDVKIACYSNKALILVWWKKKKMNGGGIIGNIKYSKYLTFSSLTVLQDAHLTPKWKTTKWCVMTIKNLLFEFMSVQFLVSPCSTHIITKPRLVKTCIKSLPHSLVFYVQTGIIKFLFLLRIFTHILFSDTVLQVFLMCLQK